MVLQKELIISQTERISKMKTSEPYFVDFLGKQIIVHKNVFYPSADTRLLTENVKVNVNDSVLECCSGTGAIAVTLAKKVKEMSATDISPYCVENTIENAKLHNVIVNVFLCDLFPPLEKRYDVIIINPPYTNHTAKDIVEQAYWDNGHKTVHNFLANAKKYLNSNGRVYLSWADFANFKFIEKLFKQNNYNYSQIAESKYKGNIYRVYELTL